MSSQALRFRPWRLTTFRLGLLVTLVFALLKWQYDHQLSDEGLNLLQRLENAWLDTKFQLRGGRDPEQFQREAHVVIAAIDEPSVRRLGMWPWPRRHIAALVRQLRHCGARVIGFDMIFSEPDASRVAPVVEKLLEQYRRLAGPQGPFASVLEQTLAQAQGDRLLAAAIEAGEDRDVVLGYFFFAEEFELEGLDLDEVTRRELEDVAFSSIGFVKVAEQTTAEEACSRFLRPVGIRSNIKMLAEATENYGYFNQYPDDDRIYRRVPLVVCYRSPPEDPGQPDQGRNEYLPALALKVLSLWYGQPIELLIDTTGSDYFPYTTDLYIGPLGMPGPEHHFIPLETAARFRANFYGPARTFRHVSAVDLIELAGTRPEQLPADHPGSQACRAVAGKAVLVGATTTGIYDLRPNPFEHSFPGVEIHATVVENVIRGDYLVRPGQLWVLELCVLLGLGLLLSWLLGRLRLTLGLVLVVLLLGGMSAGDYALFLGGLQSHALLNQAFLLVLFLVVAVWRYATEEREKSRIRHAFQFYLSRQVIDEVLRDTSKLKLGGERRELTVLFSDIRGFTTISEKLDPEALTELLNQYLTPMTEIVLANQGTLDKYIGDAIMAFFGAPVAFPDHPRAACRTALEMMERLQQLDRQWSARGLPTLDIGIGINTGEVSVGNMGSASRFDYTVIGDNVNLASRLEGLNKAYGTHIIISHSTRQAAGEHFTCRLLDSVRVKGKRLPVDIYELLHKGPRQPDGDAWLEDFERALQLYRQRRFQQALDLFTRLPDDPVARLYCERCRHMLENPPVPDWDGVFVATSK